MSECSSPVPSMSCDESLDKDEESSMSSPPHTTTLTVSNVRSSANGVEVNELKSAFRTVIGSPISMQQRLLAMLQNELSHPWRSDLRSASSEPCSSANDISPLKRIERRADEKADYYERRRKNNDSARRSREVRRQREAANRQQAEAMEKENVQLRAQIALLRLEVNQLSLVLIAEGVRPVSQ